MKRLTCEMCGSTDLIKQDGVFVCQSCGCKYSVEEAKKMMIEGTVEVAGTVRIDVSSTIENYLDLAMKSMKDLKSSEAIKYCDKVLELDPNNWKAWTIKSFESYGPIFMDDKIFRHAFQNCPDDKKEILVNGCKKRFIISSRNMLTRDLDIQPLSIADSNLKSLGNSISYILVQEPALARISPFLILSTADKCGLLVFINSKLSDLWNQLCNTSGIIRESFIRSGVYLIKAFEIGLLLCEYVDGEEADDLKNSVNQNRADIQEYLAGFINDIYEGSIDSLNKKKESLGILRNKEKENIQKEIDFQNRARENMIKDMNREKERIEKDIVVPLREECEQTHTWLLDALGNNRQEKTS